MSLQLYFLFVLASILLIATPGPNVALIVGTSLRYGARAGLLGVAGVNLGLVLQLSVIGFGLSWVVELFARYFDLIRYAGAAYLVAIGLQQLFGKSPETKPSVTFSARRAFGQGFAIAFANPKTLIFHAAFLPQFLSGGGQSGWELAVLIVTFAVIAAIGDALWALLAARARNAFSGGLQRLADRVSGGILIGGAGLLLALRRD